MATGRFNNIVLGTNLTGTDNGDGSITISGTGGAPTGAAGGSLDGTYPNPGIAASVAGAGLAETSNVLSVNVDGSTIEINSDTLRVKDAGVTEAKIGLSDVTTDDVTIGRHGFVPKAPNDAAKFLRGDGAWAAVGGSGGGVVGNDAIWDTKGDLAAATGADAAVAVPAGANGTVLTADSAQTAGVKWINNGGTELGYAEITSDATITSTSESTPTLVVSLGSITYAAVPTLIEFFTFKAVTLGGKLLALSLWDGVPGSGGTNLGIFASCDARNITAGQVFGWPASLSRRLTPSAGSHDYRIYGWLAAGVSGSTTVSAGAGGVGVGVPAFVRATVA